MLKCPVLIVHIMKIAKNKRNSMHVTGASCIGNFLIASGKMGMGIISLSFFTCASALYTYGIVLAKLYVLHGIAHSKDKQEQCLYYSRSGFLLMGASIAYIIYSIKLYYDPIISFYDKYEAILIACFTFVEIGLNIRGIIIERKNKQLLFHALKLINFASSCICLVLTQTALLSFTSKADGYVHNYHSNGFLGIIMGVIATIIGLILVKRGKSVILAQIDKIK